MTNNENIRMSHALRLLSRFEKMKESEMICDFTIKVGNKAFPVHRAVLVASSDYFEGMCSSNMKEAREGFVEMKNLGVKGIQQSVEFMYTGSAQITLESVQDILHVAELFQLDGLKGLCFQFLVDNLSPQNCLSVINLAEIYNQEDMKKVAESVVATEFEAVISSEMFPSITRSNLLRYISSVDYQTSWRAAIIWAEDKEEFPQLIEGMDIKKFPINFLLKTVLDEPLVKKSDDIKSLVVSALFSDAEELDKNLDAVNCTRFNALAKAQDIDKAIRDVISRFMKVNFEEVVAKEEFSDIDQDDVLDLFQSRETKCSSETVKWEASLKWVKHDIQNRKKVFAELFSLINLEYLSLELLKGTVREESLVKESRKCSDALLDVIFSKAEQSEKRVSLLEEKITEFQPSGKTPDASHLEMRQEKEAASHFEICEPEEDPLPEKSSPSRTVVINQQPSGGRMSSKSLKWVGAGINSLNITYSFPAGQLEGISYPSQVFKAYLPYGDPENCLLRVQKAFNAGHVFKLEYRHGQQEGRIIWGDIPHAPTLWMAGDYLNSLDEALEIKGF